VGTAGQREGAGAGKRTAPIALAHGAEREGEGALRLAPTDGACLSGTGGTRALASAQAGLSCPTWAELAFSNFLEFLLPFLFFSLGFSIQIQIKFQVQTKSNMCNNSKNI
jgi:hypothetical protein